MNAYCVPGAGQDSSCTPCHLTLRTSLCYNNGGGPGGLERISISPVPSLRSGKLEFIPRFMLTLKPELSASGQRSFPAPPPHLRGRAPSSLMWLLLRAAELILTHSVLNPGGSEIISKGVSNKHHSLCRGLFSEREGYAVIVSLLINFQTAPHPFTGTAPNCAEHSDSPLI